MLLEIDDLQEKSQARISQGIFYHSQSSGKIGPPPNDELWLETKHRFLAINLFSCPF